MVKGLLASEVDEGRVFSRHELKQLEMGAGPGAVVRQMKEFRVVLLSKFATPKR